MRWALAGLLFAMMVGLLAATAAIRADTIRQRRWLERDYLAVEARLIELRRLSVQAMAAATPERLAESLHRLTAGAGPAPSDASGASDPAGLGIGPASATPGVPIQ